MIDNFSVLLTTTMVIYFVIRSVLLHKAEVYRAAAKEVGLRQQRYASRFVAKAAPARNPVPRAPRGR